MFYFIWNLGCLSLDKNLFATKLIFVKGFIKIITTAKFPRFKLWFIVFAVVSKSKVLMLLKEGNYVLICLQSIGSPYAHGTHMLNFISCS